MLAEGTAFAAVVALALAGPHLLPLERAAPGRAACVWLGALLLRATVVGSAAISALIVLPRTGLFLSAAAVTWHRPLPLLPRHHDVPIDWIAHAAVVLPIVVLVISLAWFAATRFGAALRLRSLLERRALGAGPDNSLLVADERILVAVPGLGRGRILVSHAALDALDEAELDATLAHERGHLRRRHRPARLLGAALGRAGRLVPGGRAAEANLRFSLERDADEYAVRTTGDPIALASAIVKAARERAAPSAVLSVTGTGPAAARLEHLLAGGRLRGSVLVDRIAGTLALLLICLSAMLMAALAAGMSARPSWLALALACAG